MSPLLRLHEVLEIEEMSTRRRRGAWHWCVGLAAVIAALALTPAVMASKAVRSRALDWLDRK